MENKRMAMLVVMMLVMGNILIETEATFTECYAGCVVTCGYSAKGFSKLTCPFSCMKKCIIPKISSDIVKELDQMTHYFCQLGCAAARCASSSSIEDTDHVEKVSACVGKCSEMCSHKK